MAPQLTRQTRLVVPSPGTGEPHQALPPRGETHILSQDERRTVCGHLVSVAWAIQDLPTQPSCEDCSEATGVA